MLKILIVGSSLSSYTGKGSWLKYLEDNLNCKIENLSVTGISNYLIYNFIKEHNKFDYDYFIIFPTPHTRIPIVKGYPELSSYFPDEPSLKTFWNAFWNINNSDNNAPLDYEKALRGYLRYFADEDFLKWVTKNVLDNIQSLLPHDKTIWINGNLDRVMFDQIETGIKSIGSYNEIVLMESKWFSFNKKNIDWNRDDLRLNHLSKVNQEQFAKYIIKILTTPKSDLKSDDLNLFRVKWITDSILLEPSFAGEY